MSKIAVVGAGAWGRNLVRNFHALECLFMICDQDRKVLREMERLYPGVALTGDLNKALTSPEVAGIAIATPAETHFDLARRALVDGRKHVFVEKPLALNASDGAELIRLAEETERILMVGHLLHYHPAVLKLKSMIQGGELGKVHYIRSTRTNLGRIRSGENVLWSLAPHDVSTITMLLGDTPVAVTTSGGSHLRQGFPDVATSVLEFSNGVQGHVFTSWLHPEKEQKIVVSGDRAMAVFDDQHPEKLRIFEHRIDWRDGTPFGTRGSSRPVSLPEEEPLNNECRHFLEVLANGKSPATDGREALRVLSILDACQSSLERGGEKVLVGAPPGFPSRLGGSGPRIAPSAFVHDTAVVDPGATVGPETKIWHFSHILRGTSIGARCNLGQNVVVGPEVSVGEGCKIQNNITIPKGVTLDQGVFCGPSVVFTNVRVPRAAVPRMDQMEKTVVRKGATIGANVTIVCGVEVGRFAFIGAGALVTKDVPDFALFLGHPGRRVAWVCACGERLPENLTCTSCGAAYRYRGAEEVLIPSTSRNT